MNKTTILLIIITLSLIYLRLTKIAILTGLTTAYTLTLTPKKTPSTNTNSDVKVQPIKIKRKFDDTKSIYPDSMKINMSPAKTGVKDSPGSTLKGIGQSLGSIVKKIGGGNGN